MTDKCQADINDYRDRMCDDAWRLFRDWIDRWRDEHPDDERLDLDILIQEEYDP